MNRDAQAANAGFAIALLRVHGNSVQGYGCHLASIVPDIDTETGTEISTDVGTEEVLWGSFDP